MTVSIGLAVTDAASPQNEVVSDMQNAFEWWIGQQVVLQIAFGQIKVSLRGMLLRVETETLLMKPEAGSYLEIAKTRILAIEELGHSRSFLPRPSNELSQRKFRIKTLATYQTRT